MFNKHQYFINTVTNYAVFFSNILVALVLSPFVVRTLGDTYYGIWIIIVAFTGYYNYLDFGVRQGVSQYVSRYLSSNEYDKLNLTVNSSLIMLSFIGFIVLGITSTVSIFYGDRLVNHDGSVFELKMALFILGAGIGIKFPLLLFQTILTGKHRYDLSGLIAFSTKILYGISVYLVLLNGFGILGLAVVTTASQLLEGILMFIVAKKLVPQIRIRISKPDIVSIKEVMKYGIYNFIMGVANQTILCIGPMVIGKTIGPELVTYYTIGANLIPYYGSLVGIISIPLLQIVIAKDVNQEQEDLKILYLNGSRYLNLLVTYVAFVLIVIGEPFLSKWMGYKYINNDICSSSLVLYILALAQMIDLSQTIGRQVLFGIRKNKFLAILYTSSAIVTVGTTILFVREYSAIGAAYAILMQSLVINGILMPFYTCRLLQIPVSLFFMRTLFANLTVFVVLTALMYEVFKGVRLDNWFSIIGSLTIISVIYLIIGGYCIIGYNKIMDVIARVKPKTVV